MLITLVSGNSTSQLRNHTGQFIFIYIYIRIIAPEFYISFLIREVTFDKANGFINISRVNPALVSVGSAQRYVCPVGDSGNNPYVCLSTGVVKGCHLFSPKDPIGKQVTPRHKIDLIMIAGEFEQWLCCLGHIFDEKVLYLQIQNNAIAFETLPPSDGMQIFFYHVLSIKSY